MEKGKLKIPFPHLQIGLSTLGGFHTTSWNLEDLTPYPKSRASVTPLAVFESQIAAKGTFPVMAGQAVCAAQGKVFRGCW